MLAVVPALFLLAACSASDGGGADEARSTSCPRACCMGEAMEKLTAGAEMPVSGSGGNTEDQLTNIVLNAKGESMKLALQDQKFVAMQQRWSVCMKESGYSYPGREAAVGDPRWGDELGAAPSAEEVRVAVTDSRCQQKVNYLGVYTALLRQNDKKIIEKNSEQLKLVQDVWDTRLRNAADVIETGSAP
ncbi:hypothetical protein [Actinocorallia sp. A-T 12471]|uniref:hypothetical protein n=1 Tax=Actinocorallia sp. A-T 12471 TaxID=3089813 RepID=UPI0029D12812|nr:hypothetical protein [Actinocorallia sp. A-T 12471]MDX6742014.1 hypothetical protein [Actinocorallia sp. A-T 12471]